MVQEHNLLYIPKWMDILLAIYYYPAATGTCISKKSHNGIAHTQRVLASQMNAQMVCVKRDGKYTRYKLTDMGMEVASHVLEINKIILRHPVQ